MFSCHIFPKNQSSWNKYMVLWNRRLFMGIKTQEEWHAFIEQTREIPFKDLKFPGKIKAQHACRSRILSPQYLFKLRWAKLDGIQNAPSLPSNTENIACWCLFPECLILMLICEPQRLIGAQHKSTAKLSAECCTVPGWMENCVVPQMRHFFFPTCIYCLWTAFSDSLGKASKIFIMTCFYIPSCNG